MKGGSGCRHPKRAKYAIRSNILHYQDTIYCAVNSYECATLPRQPPSGCGLSGLPCHRGETRRHRLATVPEESALLDDAGNLLGNHADPTGIPSHNPRPDLGRGDRQAILMDVAEGADELVLHQVGVQVGQVRGDVEVVRRDELAGDGVFARIGIEGSARR